MKTKALQQLKNVINVNPDDKRFPPSYLSIHTLDRHIQIYTLISEYISLHVDLNTITTPSVRAIISSRMREVEIQLMRFWIAMDDEMIANKSL